MPRTTDPLKPSRPRKAARAALRAGTDPLDALEKVRERLASRGERFARRSHDLPYRVEPDWDESLHRLLGAPWPCPSAAEFAGVWADVLETMGHRGLRVGRQSFGGDDDSDPGLARALWCLVGHLRPERVVETGVAHGVSSRCILDALERNRRGRLWSIDLPPLTIPERRAEVGAAVPEEFRGRWTYVEGSSRRRLPGLLRELGSIQLFFHDSWHSTRNTRWELQRAWAALDAGGFMAADDIDHNWGFQLFARSVPNADVLHCPADDRQRVFGLARKRPVTVASHGRP
jgi:hypothetical protein